MTLSPPPSSSPAPSSSFSRKIAFGHYGENDDDDDHHENDDYIQDQECFYDATHLAVWWRSSKGESLGISLSHHTHGDGDDGDVVVLKPFSARYLHLPPYHHQVRLASHQYLCNLGDLDAEGTWQ